MEKETNKVHVSVRNLVEFVLRSGDLDNRRTSGDQKDAMQAGSRLHRKIQKRMGADYHAEVSMRHEVREEEFLIEVDGRADGVITKPDGVTIDEIKCIYQDVDRLSGPVPVHLAQAYCYGYFYCFIHDLDCVTIQVTYCNIETEMIRRFQEKKTREELEVWFAGVIHEYVKWARFLFHNRLRRNESLQELEFPYPYRAGQRDLAVAVYRTFCRGKRLFIQAPTGIGKTLSTVFPALRAMGEGYGEKLFYLTAKTITRSVAEESLSILRKKGLYLKSVTITAKEKLCFQEKVECNPDACPYAKGHFDRVNDAVYEIIHKEWGITRETVLEYAKRFLVCPFEFCLDISNWVDAIICDYNYVFDPNVKLKRYFSAEAPEEPYLFLIDEAHNLVSRAREMYSASLYKEEILEVKKLIKGKMPKLEKHLDKCNREMLFLKRQCESYQVLEQISMLVMELMETFSVLDDFLNEYPDFSDRPAVLEFYFTVRNFLSTYERIDGHYRIYSEQQDDERFMVKILCMDPSEDLRQCLDQGSGSIFFSATMLPIRYYKALLTGEQEDYAIYAHSPFPPENRTILIGADVSSRYTRRNRREFERIGEYIVCLAEAKIGNYLIFFPSYQYLREVRQILEERGAKEQFELVSQSTNMHEKEKEAFLQAFRQEGAKKKSLLGLCVMGGVFSEGIDLKEDSLIGTAIVGTGLPMVCLEQEILRQYFDETMERGFDYAYQFPGMNKVLQAAGRVIRTVQDKGVILLLDDRFLQPNCKELFPREWEDAKRVTLQSVQRELREFWDRVSR